MKKILIFFVSAFIASSCVLHLDKDLYIEGYADIYDNVKNLEIDWNYGKVKINYWDKDYISFYEEDAYGREIEHSMCYFLRKNTLYLAYTRNNTYHYDQAKTLIVNLPQGTTYRNIDIEAVNADIDVDADCRQIDIDTNNGNVIYSTIERNMDEISLDTDNGNVTLYLPVDASFTLDFDTSFGHLYSEFDLIYNANEDHYFYGNNVFNRTEIEVDTENGDFDLKVNK